MLRGGMRGRHDEGGACHTRGGVDGAINNGGVCLGGVYEGRVCAGVGWVVGGVGCSMRLTGGCVGGAWGLHMA